MRGFDALPFLRNCGPPGATVAQAAQAHHGSPQKAGSAQWKQTERKLRRLVHEGLATHQSQAAVGSEARYFAVDTARGHRVSAKAWTGAVDTTLTSRGHVTKVPDHAVDAAVDTSDTAPSVDTGGGVYTPPPSRGESSELEERFF
jgi:hypothetical protein